MPRTPRVNQGGIVYHVLNRANARMSLFDADADYERFMNILADAHQRVAMRTLGYCIMPNHWHLLLWPHQDGDLSEFMRWLTVTHTQRWHVSRGTTGEGHIYQGRYKSFPVQQTRPSAEKRAMGFLEGGDAVLTVLRYIERNPVQSGLVKRAENWPWSSGYARQLDDGEPPIVLTPPSGGLPEDWQEWVNQPQTEKEQEALQQSIRRGCPFGHEDWIKRTASKWGLESTLRPHGRPKKPQKGT
jgi:putative transposase